MGSRICAHSLWRSLGIREDREHPGTGIRFPTQAKVGLNGAPGSFALA
jgi:hypothetical protein